MPGKSHRNGLTILELFKRFPDDTSAEKWFEEQRWKKGRFCPDCGSTRTVPIKNRKPMPYRCRDCRRHFSVRKGTAMQSSKIGYQKWAIALYMMTTGIKGTSSMKLHRELGVRQPTAWFMMQRIREGFMDGKMRMAGEVEVDETYIGGLQKNKHKHKRIDGAQGGVGKSIVIGAKARDANQVDATVIPVADRDTMHEFIEKRVSPSATVYTDENRGYYSIPYDHDTVLHNSGEYVRGRTHINGMESFWAMFKRGYKGTYHKMSKKHLNRYIAEFAGRHNVRELDTIDQMASLAASLSGKRCTYRDLTADH